MTKHVKFPIWMGWLCCGMTLFSACGQSEVEELESESLRMSVNASIEHLGKASLGRYAGDNPNEVGFVENDRIGVFVDASAAEEWTFGPSGWQADRTIYWPDKTAEHTFYAFYPYAEAASKAEVPMPDLLNQTGDMESLSKCDFLVAETRTTYKADNGAVNFTEDNSFKHVSSLVELTIKGDGDLQTATLTGISLESSDLVTSTTYSFETKAVSLVADAHSDVLEATLNHEMNGENATFYWVVNEKTDASLPVKLAILYTSDGKNYKAELNGLGNNLFVKGVKQSYTLSIKDSALLLVGSSISAWATGEEMKDVTMNGEEVVNTDE